MTKESAGARYAASAPGASAASTDGVDRLVRDLWLCFCGARNGLRDTTCRACGDYKPEAHK